MRVITITENNIKDVYGRLMKFFYNRNHTGFLSWHNFDCGFKKHINPKIDLDGSKVETFHEYPSPDEVELAERGEFSYIVMRLMPGHGISISCGDKIAFCGNRIIFRTKFSFDHNYLYQVFQVLPMDEEEQYSKKEWAAMEEEAYEREYEREYYEDLMSI